MNQQTIPYKNLEVGNSFLSKVFIFFALAILISAGGTYVSVVYFTPYFLENPALMYVGFALELVLMLTSRLWSTKSPINKILFFIFAFLSGASLGPLIGILLSSATGVAILWKALLATGLMFTATAIFGAITKINLLGLRGMLVTSLIGMVIVSIIGIFIPWGSTFELVFSGIGIILFSLFAAFDLQRIKNQSSGDYISAALNLYLDIFNLFVYILRFIISISSNE